MAINGRPSVTAFAPDGGEWEIDADKWRAEVAAGHYQGWMVNGVKIPIRSQIDAPPAASKTGPAPSLGAPLDTIGPWQRLAAKTRINDRSFPPYVKWENGREIFKVPQDPTEEQSLKESGFQQFEPSAMDVLSTSGAKGASLGFSDEIKGGLGAIPKWLLDNPDNKSLVENYTDIRDQERKRQEAVRAGAPISSTLEEFAAGAMIPAGLVRGAASKAVPALRLGLNGAPTVGRAALGMGAEGAAYGAASGLGNAQGTPLEQALATVQGGVAGATVGAGAGALGNKFMSRPGTYKPPKFDLLSPSSWLNEESLMSKAAMDRAASLRASPGAQETLAQTVLPGQPVEKGLDAWGRAMNTMDQPIPQTPSSALGRWNQRRPAPLLGPDADAVGIDNTLRTVTDKTARDIGRIEAPLADVPVPFDPLREAIQKGPIAGMRSNPVNVALGGGTSADRVEQAVLGPLTPKPIVKSARVTSVDVPNPNMEWFHTDPLVRQVKPPVDPNLPPWRTGNRPVITEEVPNPGFDPVRALDPSAPPAPMPGRPTLPRPVSNPAYGERTEIVPPVRFSTSEPTLSTTIDAPPGDPGIGTRFSPTPGKNTTFADVMRTARQTRQVAADRGAEFGASAQPGLKAEAEALDQSAGILAGHGHAAVEPGMTPEAAAQYQKVRQTHQTAQRGLDAVNATRQTAAAPGNGLATEMRGQVGATIGNELQPGGIGAIFGARVGRALSRLKNVFPNSAYSKTRYAEALTGDARTRTGNLAGQVLKGVRAAPYSATLAGAATAGDMAARSADFDPELSDEENLKRSVLLRWLNENAKKE